MHFTFTFTFLTVIEMQVTGPQILIFGYELISEIDWDRRFEVGFPTGQNIFSSP